MTETMRRFRLPEFGGALCEDDTAVPGPEGREVLVRVGGCGVCHSDLHIADGYFDLGNGGRLPFHGIDCPLTMGHEIAGKVVAAGPEAGALTAGAPVLVYPWIGCGSCPNCAAGREHLCPRPRTLGVNRDGGYADYVLVPDPRYLIDIGDLDPVAAAPLGCSGLTTYSAIRKFATDPASVPLVIFGAGGLGLMALQILRMLRAAPPVVVEIDPAKRDAALAAGAAAAIDPQAPDAAKQIRKAAGGAVLSVLDLVGSDSTTALGAKLLGAGGRMVVVGLLGGELRLPVPLLPLKSIAIEGSYVGSLAELRELVALVRENGAPELPLDRRPLAEAARALDDLRAGRVLGRVVLVP